MIIAISAVHSAIVYLSWSILAAVVVSAFWVCHLYRSWAVDFSHRHSRRSGHCPSNKNTPLPSKQSTSSHHRRTGSGLRERWKSLTPRESSLRASLLLKPNEPPQQQRPSCSSRNDGSLSNERAHLVDVDHVYLDFFQYVWFQTLISPGLLLHSIAGLTWMRIRDSLYRRGWTGIKRRHDESRTAARLLLETSLAIHYKGRVSHDRNIAVFSWPELPIVKQDGSFAVVNGSGFKVHLHLKEKVVVAAWLDEESVTPSQCLILLMWAFFAVEHPKMHGFTNWAVNHESEQRHSNPEQAWQSVVTTGYNYLGYTSFGRQDLLFGFFGHLSPQNHMINFQLTAQFCEHSGIVEHSGVTDLARYSDLVRFIVALRLPFLREFAKYKERYFPGVDGEAFFVATVVHALEHSMVGQVMRDSLWLDVDCPKFGCMAELMRLAMLYIDEKTSFLPFSTKMKDSTNAFFCAAYAHAAKIDTKLADLLDVCVCK